MPDHSSTATLEQTRNFLAQVLPFGCWLIFSCALELRMLHRRSRGTMPNSATFDRESNLLLRCLDRLLAAAQGTCDS
eukprot:COSAG01_NODE_2750_length_7146_cov_288.987578_8_plen_77_part_00